MTEPTQITMAEIARQAQVSVSTVSKVLNGRSDVSARTRATVQRLFVQHGYHRPRRKTGAGRGDVIDLVINELDSAWSLALLGGIEEVCETAGVGLIVSAVHGRPNLTQRWLESHVARGSQGAILVTADLTTVQRAEMARRGVPFVVVNGVSLPPGTPSVATSNSTGALDATNHLIGLGHRRIATISGPPHNTCTQARTAAHRAALAAAGLPEAPELLRTGNFHHDGGLEQTQALLALSDPPTAIFAGNDQQALGVYEALRQADIDIPGRVSVVGFDDVSFARWMAPPLTTVRQPLHEMGTTAARMLLTLIGGQQLARPQVELATTLVVRDSTSTPA